MNNGALRAGIEEEREGLIERKEKNHIYIKKIFGIEIELTEPPLINLTILSGGVIGEIVQFSTTLYICMYVFYASNSRARAKIGKRGRRRRLGQEIKSKMLPLGACLTLY